MSGDDRRDDEAAIALAIFRYQVIAPLVERETSAPGVAELVAALAGQTFFRPGYGAVSVSERTIYLWLAAYRAGGLPALRPKQRSDRGESRVSGALIERALALRKENPKRWTSTLIDILVREGTWHPPLVLPHRATFDRHLDQLGGSRCQLKVLGSPVTITMAFDAFGDLWVGDYHHGPIILGPNGEPMTAKLGAFLDHKTRYPVADRYYGSEDLVTLRDTLFRAFLRWGPVAKIIYVDRGSVYRSDQLIYSLDRVDIKLVHSRRYYSQGRGLIEKWWQIVGQFEDEIRARDELVTLDELNVLWEAYRELRYCDDVHSAIKMTPNEAVADVQPQPIDPDVLRELFLVKADRTVNKRDACVQVENRRFLCDGWLRKRKVTVRYDPRDLSSVLIFYKGARAQRAFPKVPNAKPEPPPTPEQIDQSVDYLALIRRDYDEKLLEQAKPLAYAKLEVKPEFDLDAFLTTVSDLAGFDLRAGFRADLVAFWETYGPLPEALVRIAVEHAIRLHGRGRHPQIYLHSVRTLVRAHFKSRNNKEKP